MTASFAPESGFSLALGAGGGRGWAHIGVAQALEERGLRPSVIVGASIGSVVGAGLAMGLRPEQITAMAETTDVWSDCRRGGRYAYADPRGLIERMVGEVGDPRIEELPIPFAATTYDLVAGEQVVIRSGRLSQALLRSTAIPLVFPPRTDGRSVWVDAGIWEGMPVSVARSLAPHPVLGVEVLGVSTRALTMWPVRHSLRIGARLLGTGQPGDRLTARRYLALLSSRVILPAINEAPDLMVRPDLGWANPMRFGEVQRLAQAGYEATHRALGDVASADIALPARVHA